MQKVGKNFKIWGMSYAVIGDLIMGLPMLTYFEKKYPGSYKYWVIKLSCAQSLPLFVNHPLIDKIHITGEWDGFNKNDLELANSCDIQTVMEGWKHSSPHWYNQYSCVEETARLAGIMDMPQVLTEDEMFPKLYKWFKPGHSNIKNHSRAKHFSENTPLDNVIAIWPFASGETNRRNAPKNWWNTLIAKLIQMNYIIHHFGLDHEPDLFESSNYIRYTNLPYFEQVKVSLASKVAIGTDSGSAWVLGAYSHPCVNLITNWLPNHKINFYALAPIGKNNVTLFGKDQIDNISINSVIENIEKLTTN